MIHICKIRFTARSKWFRSTDLWPAIFPRKSEVFRRPVCTVIAPGMVNTAFFDEPKPDKLQPEDVALAVLFALEADPRCAVNEVFLMPTQ